MIKFCVYETMDQGDCERVAELLRNNGVQVYSARMKFVYLGG